MSRTNLKSYSPMFFLHMAAEPPVEHRVFHQDLAKEAKSNWKITPGKGLRIVRTYTQDGTRQYYVASCVYVKGGPTNHRTDRLVAISPPMADLKTLNSWLAGAHLPSPPVRILDVPFELARTTDHEDLTSQA